MRGFPGGVHPPDHKHLSAAVPIEPLPLPGKLVLTLRQNIGAAPKLLVKVGDTVRRGQCIAAPDGHVSVPLHAPRGGKIVGIGPFDAANGHRAQGVVIDTGHGDDDEPELLVPIPDWQRTDPSVLLKRVRDAGIVGMGGACFPAHVKLAPPAEKPVDILVLNGAECEPYLTADHRLMVERSERVVTGARILQAILGVARVAIAVEKNKPDAIAALREAAAEHSAIDVQGLEVKYPQGSEKQLVFALTGRRVPPPPGLPLDVGAVVQNVATAAAVTDAVINGQPLIDRVVTVSGEAVAQPKNLQAPIGTLFRDLIDHCGGFNGEPGKLVSGGPMMGMAQRSLDVPMTKGTSGVLVFSRDAARHAQPNPCLRCGACIEGCPMSLIPVELDAAVRAEDLQAAERLGIDVCVECGSCAYVCPSHRHLVHMIRLGKSHLHAQRQQRK